MNGYVNEENGLKTNPYNRTQSSRPFVVLRLLVCFFPYKVNQF